jgi:hypothetical protein
MFGVLLLIHNVFQKQQKPSQITNPFTNCIQIARRCHQFHFTLANKTFLEKN